MTLNFQQREVLEIAAGVRRGAIYNFMGKHGGCHSLAKKP